MQKREVIVIPMLIVFALGITGLAYAHWEKTITISGSVASGSVDVIIITVSHNDYGLDPSGGSSWYDKDIAKTTIIIDPQDPERAIMTIENAYPSYEVWCHATVRNVGTVPVKLQAIDNTDVPSCLRVVAWDGLGAKAKQLDPYDWGVEENSQEDVSWRVHVEQCAEPDNTYTFTIEFIYVNWNEIVP